MPARIALAGGLTPPKNSNALIQSFTAFSRIFLNQMFYTIFTEIPLTECFNSIFPAL
jgi:hypothetical protein